MPSKSSSTILKTLLRKYKANSLDSAGTTQDLSERLEKWERTKIPLTPESLLEPTSETFN